MMKLAAIVIIVWLCGIFFALAAGKASKNGDKKAEEIKKYRENQGRFGNE